jgi:hypothetical protein
MIGETAQLITELLLKDQLSGGVSSADSKLGGLSTTAGRATGSTSLLSRGLSGVEGAAKKVGGALEHAGSQISGLISNMGLFAGGAGLLGIAGAMEQSVSKVEAVGNAALALSQKTGQSVESMSALLAVTNKLGISEDSVSTIGGMYEKTVGKLAETTAAATKVQASAHTLALEQQKTDLQAVGAKTTLIDKLITEAKAQDKLNASQSSTLAPANKLVALQNLYGVTLTDNKGQAIGFSDALLNVADSYTKATSAADKAKVAALASQVFGRGYQTLTPYLSLGRQGILDAQAEAAQMGEVLTAQNVAQLAQLRDTQRAWNATLSGLEIQAGLTIIPMLTDIGNAANKYLADPTNRASLLGALTSVENIAASVAGAVGGIFGTIAGWWGKLPGPLQELLIGGIVANKAAGWLFGGSPLKAVASGAAGIIGSLLGKVPGVGAAADAALGVTHVWVDNMGVGGLGGGLAGAAESAAAPAAAGAVWTGAAGLAAGAATVAAPLAIGAVAVNQYMNTSNQADAIASQTGDFVKTATLAQLEAARKATGDAAQQLIGQWWNPFAAAAQGGLQKTLDEINTAIEARLVQADKIAENAVPAPTQAQANAFRRGERGTIQGGTSLSGQLATLLSGGGAIGAGAAAKADALASVFKESTGPSLVSMNGALKDLKALYQRYLSQGDTRLAATINGDISSLKARVDAVTAAIKSKQFTVQQITTAQTIYRQGERGDVVVPKITSSGGSGGNVGGDAYPVKVNVTVSARQNQTANTFQTRWGPTPVMQGAQ